MRFPMNQSLVLDDSVTFDDAIREPMERRDGYAIRAATDEFRKPLTHGDDP